MAYKRKRKKKESELRIIPKRSRKIPRKIAKTRSESEKVISESARNYLDSKRGSEATFLGKYAYNEAQKHLERTGNVSTVSPGAEKRFMRLLEEVS